MTDGEQDPLQNILHCDNRLLYASFASILLVTSTCLIWGTKRVMETGPGRSESVPLSESAISACQKQPLDKQLSNAETIDAREKVKATLEVPSTVNVSDALPERKSTRSKERRRRGKDPMKELAKAVKKGAKADSNVNKAGTQINGRDPDASSNATTSPAASTVPLIVEPEDATIPRRNSFSFNSSSRSASRSPTQEKVPSVAPNLVADIPDVVEQSLALHSTPSQPKNPEDHFAANEYPETTPTPNQSNVFTVQPASNCDLETSDGDLVREGVGGRTVSAETCPVHQIGVSAPSSSTENSEYNSSDSSREMTPSTSPPASLASSDKLLPQAVNLSHSKSMPPYYTSEHLPKAPKANRALPPPGQFVAHWDLDLQSGRLPSPFSPVLTHGGHENAVGGPSHQPSTSYRKPPRFRSKNSSGSNSPIPTSVSYSFPFTSASASIPSSPYPSPVISPHPAATAFSMSSSIEEQEIEFPTLTFPTLNPTPPPAEHPRHLSVSGVTNSPRRVPTPRTALAPGPNGTGTPPPSSSTVSAQTQLASMRGALEAVKLREEKAKTDAERLAKECEMLKWRWGEATEAWRRRETEQNAQIQHLLVQLQTYAGFLASITHQQPLNPSPGGPSLALFHAAQQQQNALLASQQSHASRTSLFPITPQSPLNLNVARHHQPLRQPSPSPFLGYPTQGVPMNNTGYFNSLLPPSISGAVTSESSSVESLASDILNSPLWDRGRQRESDREQTEFGGESDGGWIAGEDEQQPAAEKDGGFSGALADAILKDSGSLRAKSKKPAENGGGGLKNSVFSAENDVKDGVENITTTEADDTVLTFASLSMPSISKGGASSSITDPPGLMTRDTEYERTSEDKPSSSSPFTLIATEREAPTG